MKHASAERLGKIVGVLERVRGYALLKEKKLGVFYRKTGAFLHFHEDAKGMFADVRTARGWKRLAVNSRSEVQMLVRAVEKELGVATPQRGKSRKT